MCFALGEMTARKNAQPKQKRLRIQLLPGDYMSKVRNIFCRPEQPEKGVKKGIKKCRPSALITCAKFSFRRFFWIWFAQKPTSGNFDKSK
jgi:hypothetical protein